MQPYYLAIDIGASSGRHIIASLKDNKLVMEEVFRFENSMIKTDGSLCWDTKNLYANILDGIKKCKEIGKTPSYIGIDTWGVDFVLLNKNNEILGKTYGYRDNRTSDMDEEVYKYIPHNELYKKTGIQKQLFNTIYQLMAVKTLTPNIMDDADSMLMIPDYFNFLLTGIKKTEYTNASTTQLLNPETKDWDYDLIDTLGFNKNIFCDIETPGTILGSLTDEVAKYVGFDAKVVLPATHDTGSAVIAVPAYDDNSIYISSGTWSLMGIERQSADCSIESMNHNFTNEGGYDYRFRYLKNIMGLWMIQSVKKEFKENLSFAEICYLASKEDITSIVDCNADCFYAPESMIYEVQEYCRNTNQQVPETPGQIATVIYNSLAECYKETVNELEEITHNSFDCIHVVGGGSNAAYLNELTAKKTGKIVYAGPGEATAIGNILSQMICTQEISDLKEARKCVRNSFNISKYMP